MKKLTVKLSLCAIAATLAIASCSKKSSSSNNNATTQSKLVGTWKFHEQIGDANNNQTIDASDPIDYTVDSLNITITFNSNSTYTQYQSGFGSGTGTWSVNGNYLVIKDSTSATQGLLIVSGPTTTITVADTSSHPRVWTVLNKQ